MSEHTPGPWEWKQPYENAGYWQLVAIGDYGVHPSGSKVFPQICDDGSAGDEYPPSIDVHGPDARLIAAAPELLAACKAVIHDRPSAHTDAVWQQVNDAIAKAEGQP